MNCPFNGYCRVFVLIFGVVFSALSAADLTVSGNTQTHFTDNANQEPEDSEDEIDQSLGLNVGYTHESKRYVADVDYTLSHNRYFKDVFQNETNFTGIGTVNYHLLPTNFDWFASYQRDTFLNSSNVANTPSNRSSQAQWSTGPRYTYELTDSSIFLLSSTYSESINGSAIGSDSRRVSSSVTFLHQINPVTDMSTKAEHVDVIEFENGEEYTQNNYSLGFTRTLKNGELDINVGYNRVARDRSEDVNERSFDISFEHQVFSNTVTLRAISEVTDSTVGLSVRDLIDSGLDNVETNFSQVDIVKRKRYEAEISRELLGYGVITLFGYRDDEDFVSQDQDERDTGASVAYDVFLSSATMFQVSVSRERTEFLSQPSFGENETTDYHMGLNISHTERFSTAYDVSFAKRVNDVRKASEYEEIEAQISLNYQFL